MLVYDEQVVIGTGSDSTILFRKQAAFTCAKFDVYIFSHSTVYKVFSVGLNLDSVDRFDIEIKKIANKSKRFGTFGYIVGTPFGGISSRGIWEKIVKR